MENKFEINRFSVEGYQIGTFMFNYRKMETEGEPEIELDVYKISGPVILYIKTYKAPFLEEATPEDMCEALYEEFFAMHEGDEDLSE